MLKKLLLFTVLISLLLGVSCAPKSSGTSASSAPEQVKAEEPEEVFKKFIGCIGNDDLKGAWSLLSKESQAQFSKNDQPSFQKFESELKNILSSPEEKEKIVSAVPYEVTLTATVKFKHKDGQNEKDETVNMVKENGEWKLILK